MKTKRTLSFLLSVILLLNLPFPAFAAEDDLYYSEEILQETEFLSENGYARVSKTDSYVILETTRKVATEGVGMVGYSRIANTLQVYENESIVFIPVDEDTSAAIYDTVSSALPRSIQNGSHEVTEADDFGCARFTIKISYTVEQKDDGFTYYEIKTRYLIQRNAA